MGNKLSLIKVKRQEILEDPLSTEERKASGQPFCKYGCGLCAFCDNRYATGHCSHTAYISGIDQGGSRLRHHMMEEHLSVWEYPAWTEAKDYNIISFMDRLEERVSDCGYDWDIARLVTFIERITDGRVKLLEDHKN